jgi:hypothetical protein
MVADDDEKDDDDVVVAVDIDSMDAGGGKPSDASAIS